MYNLQEVPKIVIDWYSIRCGRYHGETNIADTVRAGFEKVFAEPMHPGSTCPECGETFYVETIAQNHCWRRNVDGMCPATGDWDEHIRGAMFYFDVRPNTALLMHHVQLSDVVQQRVNALDPTVCPAFMHGDRHPIE